MAIKYPEILELTENNCRVEYSDQDTILYALGIGLGSDPLSSRELPFVYEQNLQAVPTFGTTIAGRVGVNTERLGVNYKFVLHGEEETILHRPMPPAAKLIADSGVEAVYDKGAEKGALVVRRTVLRDEQDGGEIATLKRTIFARADGGCGGSDQPPPKPHSIPDRSPDEKLSYSIRKDQAALYRLSGDRNPLHIDPARATAAGLPAPILHGLCTYGMACRAVLEAYCDFDAELIASHAARFSAPVFPGELIEIEMWRDNNVVSFQVNVPARGVAVIKNGRTCLR